MSHPLKKALALLCSLAILFSLCPTALAASSDGSVEYEYVEAADGIESGAVYAIFYAGTNSNRILYHASGSAATDQVTGTVADGKLTLNTGFPVSRQTWLIEGSAAGGYTIQSQDDQKYLNINGATSASAKIPVTEEAQALTLTQSGDGTYTISRVVDGTSYYVHHDDGTTQWYVSGDPTEVRLFKQTEVEVPEPDPEPEIPAPPADFTSYEYVLDTDGVESGAVYAIYAPVVSSGNPRIMHHTAGSGRTDQCGGSTSGDLLNLGSCGNAHLWEITGDEETGYTIRSLIDGNYLNYGTAGVYNHLPVTETAQAFAITSLGDGNYHISWQGDDAACYVDWNGKWGASTEPYEVQLYKQTAAEPSMAQIHFSGTSTEQPLITGADGTGSNYFRIPSLLTLDNGWILAASDIRWRTSADNPQNLDTIVSISKDNGQTWEWEVVNYYADEAITTTSQASAAFIDPSFIQSADGTVYMAVDATPSYVGLMSGNRRGFESSGFDGQGRMLVALGAADADAPTSADSYNYYVDLNAEGLTYYPICARSNDRETGYYVDAFLDLYYGEDMEPVLCVQRGSSDLVQNNIFYRQSQWKAYPGFFIMIRSAQVTETGLEWSEPKFVDVKLSEDESFLGVCPGRGITTILDDGTERVIFPLYDNKTGTELASVIYSDDGGQTWTRGSRANDLNGTGKSSESQIVRLPDGNLRMYSRNTINYIGYADSTDGGQTWGQYTIDYALASKNPGNGCMVSFINLDGVLIGPDNEVYENLILASYPVTQRSVGTVRIGSIGEDNIVTWLNEDTAVRFDETGSFAYSCVTQLQLGGLSSDVFGLLYEYGPNGTICFTTMDVNDLLGAGWFLVGSAPSIMPEITLSTGLVELDLTDPNTCSAVVTATAPEGLTVFWHSSNELVATVVDGTVTAVAPGSAVITAEVSSGGVIRTASAEVVVQGNGIITVPERYTSALDVQVMPERTTYELDADGIDSGAVYAVYAVGGNRLLYHAAPSNTTNQNTPSLDGSLLSLDPQYAKESQLWTVTGDADNGYTLQSLSGETYLNGTSTLGYNQLPVTAAPQSFAITALGGGEYNISWDSNGTALYVSFSGKWGASEAPYTLRFYQEHITEAYATYTVSAEGLLALIAEVEASGDLDANTAAALAAAKAIAGTEPGEYTVEAEAEAAQTAVNQAARVLYAVWKGLSLTPVYTITYQITGKYFADSKYATQSYAVGDAVAAIAAPRHTGYTFEGWTGVPEVMPDHDVTVTGYFTQDVPEAPAVTPVIPTPTPEPDDSEPAPAPEAPVYWDVSGDAWYADAVAYVAGKGLMNGTSATAFSPDAFTTRGMIVTILYRLENEPAAAGSSFSDVASGQYYTSAVAWASANGIVTGYADGTFRPAADITREQLAVILYRYASYKGCDVTAQADLSGYTDADQIGGFATDAMRWATAQGLVNGVSASALAPQGTATRAQVAAILMRFCENIAK